MIEILKDLYQGNREDAINASHEHLVDYVVYVGQELPLELSHHSPVPIAHIPLKDGRDNVAKWKLVEETVRTCHNKGKTLVACRGGISRSPTVILYHILRTGGFVTNGNLEIEFLGYKGKSNFEAAYKFVKAKIPMFQPERNLLRMIRRRLEWYGSDLM